MIDLVATKFNFLRIPVTWYPHLTTGAPSYTVDPAFLARLKLAQLDRLRSGGRAGPRAQEDNSPPGPAKVIRFVRSCCSSGEWRHSTNP